MSSIGNRLQSVNTHRHCELCRGRDGCSFGDGGDFVLCRRVHHEMPGWTNHGPSPRDPQWSIFRREGTHRNVDGHKPGHVAGADKTHNPVSVLPTIKAEPTKPRDWERIARLMAENFKPERRAIYEAMLELPPGASTAIPLIGWDPDGYYTQPEYDRDPERGGKVCGLSRRHDSHKDMVKGSSHGAIYATGWRERAVAQGVVFVVEGHSDTLGSAAAGLAAVGRFSATGGVEKMAVDLAELPASVQIVVVAEHDQKPPSDIHPDGIWPGRDGAIHTAQQLANRLGRPVYWALPPDGAKDVRAWLTAGDRWIATWSARGDELRAALVAAAVVIDPDPTQAPDSAQTPEAITDAAKRLLESLEAPPLATDPDENAELESARAVHRAIDVARERLEAKTCGFFRTCGNESTGQIGTFDVQCSLWKCLKCSKIQKEQKCVHFENCLRNIRKFGRPPGPTLWVHVIEMTAWESRFYDQIRNKNGTYVGVKKADELTATVCATVPFKGAREVSVDEAVVIVTGAIQSFPTFDDSKNPIFKSTDWNYEEEETESEWRVIDDLPPHIGRTEIESAYEEEAAAKNGTIESPKSQRLKRPFCRWGIFAKVQLDRARTQEDGPWPQFRDAIRRIKRRIYGESPFSGHQNSTAPSECDDPF